MKNWQAYLLVFLVFVLAIAFTLGAIELFFLFLGEAAHTIKNA